MRQILLLVLVLAAVTFTLAVRFNQTNKEVVLKGNTQTDPPLTFRVSESKLAPELKGSKPLPNQQPKLNPLPEEKPQVQELQVISTEVVHLTFYSCFGPNGGYCGNMSNGKKVHDGAAACDSSFLPQGTRFRIKGEPKVYACEDRGGEVRDKHVDLWFESEADGWAYLQKGGTEVEIEILR